MIKDGLLVEPNYESVDEYLKPGPRTYVTSRLQNFANLATGDTEENLVRDLLVKMNKHTEELKDAADD